MLKYSSERWVCAAQSLSLGTPTSPRLSVSLRMPITDTLLIAAIVFDSFSTCLVRRCSFNLLVGKCLPQKQGSSMSFTLRLELQSEEQLAFQYRRSVRSHPAIGPFAHGFNVPPTPFRKLRQRPRWHLSVGGLR